MYDWQQSLSDTFLGTGPVSPKPKYAEIDPRVNELQANMAPWLSQMSGMPEEARNRDFAGTALMQGALDRAAAQQMGAAASTRGMSPIAAARIGGQMGNQMRLEAMPQLAALRAQEQAQQYQDILKALGMGGEMQLGTSQAALNPYTQIEVARLGGTMPGQPGMMGQVLGGLAQGAGAGLTYGMMK